MSDRIHFDKESLMENLDELKIKIALISYMDLEGKSLVEENKALYNDDFFRLKKDTKQKFRKSINRYYHKRQTKNFLHISRRIISRAAVVLFFILVSLSIPVFSVEAIRTRVLNFIIDVNDEYTSVKLNPDDDRRDADLKIQWEDAYAPARIPKGYELSSVIDKTMKALQYTNAEGSMITFQQWGNGGVINIDTENADNISKVIVQGSEGMLVEKGDIVTLTWSNNTYIFVITIVHGVLSYEEALDIAESVSLIK